MGKTDLGILGAISGKVGPVVGSSWKSKNVIKAKGKKPTKFSQKQIEHRAKFGLLMRFFHPMSPLIKKTFSDLGQDKTAMNLAFAHNFSTTITGAYPNFTIDYTKMIISKGSLLNANGITATAGAASDVKFQWTSNPGGASANATDKCIALVYCPEMGACNYILAGSARTSGSYSLDASNFKGKVVETWLAFIAEDQSDVSTSIYTGQVTIL